MSDQIEKLLQRIAVLEAAASEKKAAPAFDNADVVGSLSKMGADIPHATRVLVANAMGDQAPPELRVLAQMGPQVSATRALESKFEELSRQLTDVVTSSTKKSARESFRALTSDKTKYPALAWALAADPDFLNEELERHEGSAEEFAAKMEARFSKLAPRAPQSASEEGAETTERSDSVMGLPNAADDDQRQQVESALGNEVVEAPPPARKAPLNSRMPPLQQQKTGVFTQDEHERLKAEVLRKYS